MNYQPNFTDARVVKRIHRAYGFARGMMSTTKPTRLAQSLINKYMGHQTDNLGKYLRQILLITTNNHYSMDSGITKEYMLNVIGLDYIRYQLKTPNANMTWNKWCSEAGVQTQEEIAKEEFVRNVFDAMVVTEWAKREYGPELASLNFTYTDKSGRLWHPLQNIRSKYKPQILGDAGLKYHYDINSAAPTLLMRYAQQLGMDEWPAAINEYIQFKDVVRETLADSLGIPIKDIKITINALFCGARLGNNKEFALYQLLGNKERVELLRTNQFITELREDIKCCWSYIQTTMNRKTITDVNGITRLVPVNSKQKWAVYFQLERHVLNSVREYLEMTNNKYFLEHDGWSTEQPIDIPKLLAHIKTQTGFSITLHQSISECPTR